VLIREERPTDHAAVQEIHRAAFASHPDAVIRLVVALRRSLTTKLGLSLVAVDDHGSVAGHVLFTHNLLDAPQRLLDVQVLSPLGVRPDAQGRGVGSELVRHGLCALADAGVPAVFLEGSPTYYYRFGFSPGGEHGFRRPSLRIPKTAFQVFLLPARTAWMTGMLFYRHEFWDHDAVGLRPTDPRWNLLTERT
jgi:putative acetyltransferase